jgi:prepilin-type N-terminal cleavage/methylation domain-containing protein
MSVNSKNRRGINLVELMIAVVVSAIVLMAAVQGFKSISKALNLVRVKTDEAEHITIGSERMVHDLQTLSTSFNLIKQRDDCGASFYEYADDAVCFANTENLEDQEHAITCGMGNCARVKTLTPDPNPVEESTLVFAADVYEARAHEIEFTPASLFEPPTTGGTLQMNSKEPKTMIDLASESLGQRSFWEEGKLLLVQTAGPYRDAAVINGPLKRISYVGQMNGDGSLGEFSSVLSMYVDLNHSNLSPQYFSDYLLKLPFEAGRQPLLMAKKIVVGRYFLKSIDSMGGKSAKLIRQIWDSEKNIFVNAATLSGDVKSVRFIRQSISSDIISFKLRSLHEQKSNMVGSVQ